jgi:type IV secretory pathway protease TraF
MPILEVKTPTAADRKWFGAILLAFFALIGGVVSWRAGVSAPAYALWGTGAVAALLYYAIRPLQVPMYKGWMHLVSPIGWVVSHALLALIYFGILTPIAVCMRWFGRDQLERRFAPHESYWSAHPSEVDPRRYFRQS